MGIITRREKEIGIYYSLGLNHYGIFRILVVEFGLNGIIITTFSAIIIFLITKLMYAVEVLIPPYVLFYNSNYLQLIIFGILISFLALFIVFIKIIKQDPVTIIRKI